MEIRKTELETLYKTMPINLLADHLGVTKATVYALLRRNEIPLKKPHRPYKIIKVIKE